MKKQNNNNIAWRLYGAGMGALRRDEIAIPEPKDDEILIRIDAVGLCFSDIKIIRAGASHPKLWWKNLYEHPLIPGHEVACTVVKAGKDVPAEYAKPGNRYLIQCDIYIKGRSCAFGYGMDGAFVQYGIIDARVWRGEGRSYLLPFREELSSVATALVEPWSCVRGAYRLKYRNAPATGGKVLIVGDEGCGEKYHAGELFKAAKPADVAVLGVPDEDVRHFEAELGVRCRHLTKFSADERFDDIFCLDVTHESLAGHAAELAARFGVVNFIGRTPEALCPIDVGALHYQNRYYQGGITTDLSAPYRDVKRNTVKPGGAAWFPGGAGAMGQMHVELAVTAAEPPAKILVTDLDGRRIAHLEKRLAERAKKRGIVFECLDPSKLSEAEYEKALRDFAPEGFDDVVVLVPNAGVVSFAAKFLNSGALVNMFAGIPAGEAAELSIRDIAERGVRYIGSSGSTFDDMADTLRAGAEGEFQPVAALAAVGGMNALKQGLEAVAGGKFCGKTAILPQCPDLPLTELDKLGELDPELPGTLDADGNYTRATEAMLLRKWGK